MDNMFEKNAPIRSTTPQEQPEIKSESGEGGAPKTPPVKETINRWRKEIIEKIGSLRKELEQAHLENETLNQELNRLKSELTTKKERVHVLEHQITQTLEAFNQSMAEINQSFEAGPNLPDKGEGDNPKSFFGDAELKTALSEW
jgi:hypothetical protein